MDERLRELNEELSELNGRLARANGLERRLDDLRAQYEERKARVEETARLLTKEREDVEKLERGGLRALLLSLTGDREARLSQERREELAARLQYDQARRDAEDLEERIRDLLQEREELRAGEYKITWKPVTSSRLDAAARFTRTSTARRFCVA